MFIRLGHRAVPVVMLVLSSLWVSVVLGTLTLFLLSPIEDFRHIISAFEGRETLREEFFPVQNKSFIHQDFSDELSRSPLFMAVRRSTRPDNGTRP